VHSLPLFVRLVNRPVILLGEGDAADAKRQLLVRAGAKIVGEDAQASLAIVAIEDEEEAQAAIARLKSRAILVNAVDRPAACDFTLPAIIDRDPVLIAIGTGGASAGLAKALRQRLELLLPQSLGHLATALQDARAAMRARWPGAAERRRAIDAALDPGGPLDPLTSLEGDAVDRWLRAGREPALARMLSFTITSDSPDDLTLAAARALGQADRIIHAPDLPPAIIARGRADAVRAAGDAFPDPLPEGLTVLLRRG
jgi:uroporphyrin-III C-methyltransferase / precorrin-2 dehydrogenase / sirohydrochlorin ferrochelatase